MQILKQFRELKVSRLELEEYFSESIYNVQIRHPEIVHTTDVINIIEKYLCEKITKIKVLEWVNTVWFTDLFAYAPKEENSIASVMTYLETLDENVEFSVDEYKKMIDCLKRNQECVL